MTRSSWQTTSMLRRTIFHRVYCSPVWPANRRTYNTWWLCAPILFGLACSSARSGRPGTTDIGASERIPSREGVDPARDFMLDVREVSVGEYQDCVRAGVCRPRERVSRSDSDHGFARGCRHPRSQRGNLPVNCVSLRQAMDYCAWRGKRLPTASEWMWEARGGDENRPWPWGTSEIACSRANVRGCGTKQRPRRHLQSVDSAQAGASRNGVLNLLGNVEELVLFDDSRFGTMGGSFHIRVTAPLPEVELHTRWSVAEYGEKVLGDAIGFRCVRPG